MLPGRGVIARPGPYGSNGDETIMSASHSLLVTAALLLLGMLPSWADSSGRDHRTTSVGSAGLPAMLMLASAARM